MYKLKNNLSYMELFDSLIYFEMTSYINFIYKGKLVRLFRG